MTKKRHTPEQIVTLLRQVEVADGLQPGDTTAIGIAIAGITRDVDSHSHWYKTSGVPAISAFAASHSASHGRITTGSTSSMILSRSV